MTIIHHNKQRDLILDDTTLYYNIYIIQLYINLIQHYSRLLDVTHYVGLGIIDYRLQYAIYTHDDT